MAAISRIWARSALISAGLQPQQENSNPGDWSAQLAYSSRSAARSWAAVSLDPDQHLTWMQALIAAGYTVYAVNPLQAARYRDRHGVSGAKSDAGDAHVLAELVRLDRVHHRPVAGDSAIAEHVKVLARAHQSLVWSRQRQTNMLRSMLREFYPGALAPSLATWTGE